MRTATYFQIGILTASVSGLLLTAPLTQGDPAKPAPAESNSIMAAHGQLECTKCHESRVISEFKRLRQKLGKDIDPGLAAVRDQIQLKEEDRMALHGRCQSCHEKQFADWASSGHAFTYGQSFLNRVHNKIEAPNNDCLRCHAMFFDGCIKQMVQPINNQGPWQMVKPELASHPSILCLSCHQIHPSKWPAPPSTSTDPGKIVGESFVDKFGFYDRRERQFFTASQLPQPKVHEGEKQVEVAKDKRIRVCYQCHAPNAAHQAGTSDDRTLRGVHGDLSCFDCHAGHSVSPRKACANCHSAVSDCGLDVTRMDTTFRAKSSQHDIHNMACTDCHSPVPKKR